MLRWAIPFAIARFPIQFTHGAEIVLRLVVSMLCPRLIACCPRNPRGMLRIRPMIEEICHGPHDTCVYIMDVT